MTNQFFLAKNSQLKNTVLSFCNRNIASNFKVPAAFFLACYALPEEWYHQACYHLLLYKNFIHYVLIVLLLPFSNSVFIKPQSEWQKRKGKSGIQSYRTACSFVKMQNLSTVVKPKSFIKITSYALKERNNHESLCKKSKRLIFNCY